MKIVFVRVIFHHQEVNYSMKCMQQGTCLLTFVRNSITNVIVGFSKENWGMKNHKAERM